MTARTIAPRRHGRHLCRRTPNVWRGGLHVAGAAEKRGEVHMKKSTVKIEELLRAATKAFHRRRTDCHGARHVAGLESGGIRMSHERPPAQEYIHEISTYIARIFFYRGHQNFQWMSVLSCDPVQCFVRYFFIPCVFCIFPHESGLVCVCFK